MVWLILSAIPNMSPYTLFCAMLCRVPYLLEPNVDIDIDIAIAITVPQVKSKLGISTLPRQIIQNQKTKYQKRANSQSVSQSVCLFFSSPPLLPLPLPLHLTIPMCVAYDSVSCFLFPALSKAV